MTKHDTSFINDIDASPKFIDEMIMTMRESVEEMISDYAFQIMTDYCDAPQCEHDEDEMTAQIHTPLQNRITKQILLEFIRRQINA